MADRRIQVLGARAKYAIREMSEERMVTSSPDRQVQHATGPVMSQMKGGEVIAEYLVKQKVPFVFGVCGMAMSAFSMRCMPFATASPWFRRARAVRRPHGGRVFSGEAPSGRHANLDRAGSATW